MINTTKPRFVSYVDYTMGIVTNEKKDETETDMVWIDVIPFYSFKAKRLGPFNKNAIKRYSSSDDSGENRTTIVVTEDKNGDAPAHDSIMGSKSEKIKELSETIEQQNYKIRSLQRNKKESDSSDDVKRSKEMLRNENKFANTGYDDPLDRFKKMEF